MKLKIKQNYKKAMATLMILMLMVIAVAPTVFADDNASSLGRWQGSYEGGHGEGDSFYIFKFADDGTVKLTKQFSGSNVTETKLWTLNGDQLIIKSDVGSVISEFDNNPIMRTGDKVFEVTANGHHLKIDKWNGYVAWIHLLLVLVILIGINEICRRYKLPTFILYFVIPIVLIPYWVNSGISHWFRWVKLYSVVFAAVWFTLVRYTKLGEYKFAKFVASLILCVNIGEAVTQDFSLGYLPNVLNAIGGVLNILTLSRWESIGPDKSKEKDMVWPGMTTFWIVAYDIWNWTFVYLNFPQHAGYHLMVLLACTLPSVFIKKGTWLQARAFTLAGWMIYLFTFQPFIDASVVALPRNYTLMLAAGVLSIGSNAIYAYFHFRWQFTGKAPKSLEVGQSPSVI